MANQPNNMAIGHGGPQPQPAHNNVGQRGAQRVRTKQQRSVHPESSHDPHDPETESDE